MMLISLKMREMQIKTSNTSHQDRMATDRNSTNSKCWRGYGDKGTLLHQMLEMEIENSHSGGHQAGFFAMKMKMELEYSLTPYRKRNSRQKSK